MLAETNAMNARLAGVETKVEQLQTKLSALDASTSGLVHAVGEAVGPCDPK